MPDTKSTTPVDNRAIKHLFNEIAVMASVSSMLLDQDTGSTEAQAVRLIVRQVGAMADKGLSLCGSRPTVGDTDDWIGTNDIAPASQEDQQ